MLVGFGDIKHPVANAILQKQSWKYNMTNTYAFWQMKYDNCNVTYTLWLIHWDKCNMTNTIWQLECDKCNAPNATRHMQ